MDGEFSTLKQLIIHLPSLAATESLAKKAARAILAKRLRTIFLDGPLGSGKTTFVRFLIANLPGSERAEVASPSFSVVNLYPVMPPVQHVDLYRCRHEIPDEILDNFENPNMVTIIEWAMYFPTEYCPGDILFLRFERELEMRLCHCSRKPLILSDPNGAGTA